MYFNFLSLLSDLHVSFSVYLLNASSLHLYTSLPLTLQSRVSLSRFVPSSLGINFFFLLSKTGCYL